MPFKLFRRHKGVPSVSSGTNTIAVDLYNWIHSKGPLLTPPDSPPLSCHSGAPLPGVDVTVEAQVATDSELDSRRSSDAENLLASSLGAPFSAFDGDSRLRVLVVGAGFAGLCCAIACARQGYRVTVLEKGSWSKHGDNITLGSNATKILHRWGLQEDLWAASAKGGSWYFKDYSGQDLRIEDLRHYTETYGAPMLQGSRAKYLGVLGTEARMLSVEFRLDCAVVDYHDSTKSPSLETASGEIMFADVIVVADGINSKSRDLLHDRLAGANEFGVDGDALAQIVSPYAIHRALLEDVTSIRTNPNLSEFLDGCARTWLGNDAHLTMAPLDNNSKLSFAFVHRDRSGQASLNWRDKRPISEVTSLLEDWDPQLKAAVSAFRSCLNWKKTERPSEHQWVTAGGRIVFIGDAVHPLPPSSFQGASQSVEDGAVLAICLGLAGGESREVPVALRAFQQLRRPHVEKALQIGMKQRENWHGFVTHGRVDKDLAFLVPESYSFDAELDALDSFEDCVQTFDAKWRLSPVVKAKVTRKLRLNKFAPPMRKELFSESAETTKKVFR
ncbi:hypothetical protein OIV83_003706 [Microbotryomycetes sp. JL201]|nr:hypothetical protein OIV83_003706 [Microbotryomycetes sp. JL201]